MSKLSKEEIIQNINGITKQAEKLINEKNKEILKKAGANGETKEYAKMLKNTILGLLDLYNKEVEKNKKLENDNQVLRETLYGGNVSE